jgi:hypothetical protein
MAAHEAGIMKPLGKTGCDRGGGAYVLIVVLKLRDQL